jgi:hypothetical protein
MKQTVRKFRSKALHKGTGSGREAAGRGLYEQKGLGREAAEALYEAAGWKRSRKSLVRG